MDSEHTWHPQVRDDVVFRKTGDDWLVYDPVTDDLHVLNLAAALVWSLCTGERTPDAIRDEVRDAFGLEETPHDFDVSEILDEFQSTGLLAS